MENQVNRRIRLDLMQPEEKSIYNAMQEVEKMQADKRLTNALTHLSTAKDLVSDVIDNVPLNTAEDSTCKTTGTTFHERLIIEKDELDEKINKVFSFINSENFSELPIQQQSLLRVQYHAMNTYSQCLLERLGNLQ